MANSSFTQKTGTVTKQGATPFQQEYFKNLLDGAQSWMSGAGKGSPVGQAQQAFANLFSPYDPSRVEAATGGIVRDVREQLLPGITTSAIGSGQLGSSRQGIAEGIAVRGAEEKAAELGYRDYQNYLQSQQNALRNFAGIQAGLDPQFQALVKYKDLISGEMGADITSEQATQSSGTSRQSDPDTSGQFWGQIGGATASSLIDKYL